MREALIVVLGCATAAVLLSWVFFRRYAINRPPIGVFNARDVAVMIGGILLVPFLYLALPRWLVGGLLALGMLSAVYLLWEAMLRAGWAVWLATLLLAAADLGTRLVFGAASPWFFAANDLVLVLAIVGLTNLWAQSGMRARDIALLAGLLAIYDVLATWQFLQMDALFGRIAGLPFAPLIAWPAGAGGLWLGIGVGDLLLAAVLPLVMRKAFGRAAGISALAVNLGGIAGVLGLALVGALHASFPVMIVLGPLSITQYVYWRRRGPERTTRHYLLAEPLRAIG